MEAPWKAKLLYNRFIYIRRIFEHAWARHLLSMWRIASKVLTSLNQLLELKDNLRRSRLLLITIYLIIRFFFSLFCRILKCSKIYNDFSIIFWLGPPQISIRNLISRWLIRRRISTSQPIRKKRGCLGHLELCLTDHGKRQFSTNR